MKFNRVQLLLAFSTLAIAQFDWDPRVSTMPPRKRFPPIDADVPHLHCPVCHRLVREAVSVLKGQKTRKKKIRLAPRKDAEGLCNADIKEGAWMTSLDVYQNGTSLELSQKTLGRCKRECRTIEVACKHVLEELEDVYAEGLTEVVKEAMKDGDGPVAVAKSVCDNKRAKLCGKASKVPPYTTERKDDEKHEALSKTAKKNLRARWEVEKAGNGGGWGLRHASRKIGGSTK